MPSGFGITEENFTVDDLTVTFEWDEPQGSGPEAIVDNYTVTITPMPLFPLEVNVLPNSVLSLNARLNYNTTYMVSIIAENCAGESDIFLHPVIEYGEQLRQLMANTLRPRADARIRVYISRTMRAISSFICAEGVATLPDILFFGFGCDM